jgi:hypothetical protein
MKLRGYRPAVRSGSIIKDFEKAWSIEHREKQLAANSRQLAE